METIRRTFIGAILSIALLSIATQIQAVPPLASLPDFDRRGEAKPNGGALAPEQRTALEQLKGRVPGIQVEFEPLIGTPKFISAGANFLSEVNGAGKAISAAAAARYANDPHRAIKAFLHDHNGLFGHGPEVLDKARVTREFVGARNGLRTVIWQQQVDGIPLFEAVLVSHTTKRGELVNVSSQFLPDPDAAAVVGVPNRKALIDFPEVSARKALIIAAQTVEEQLQEQDLASVAPPEGALNGQEKRQAFKAAALKGNAEVKLIWLPISKDRLGLCWDVLFMSRSRSEMFRVLVDVQTGEALVRRCLTEYISDASYRIYMSDSPSPFSPGYSTPTTNQPPLVERSLVTFGALNTNASPNGWIDDGVNETYGNNVDAHPDWHVPDVIDDPRPQGSPWRVFDFPLDLTQHPSNSWQAAVVQLFYWNNFMHDKLYELGFTEAAGNFQNTNFGRGGLGNDAVQADAQDRIGVNNANFSTPPDGSPGRMQMYLFTGSTPYRDGDLDAQIVLHEYAHGLSNRRVGGGVGLSALQPRALGEGWSDFYALSLLSEPEDDANGVYASGAFVSYQLFGLKENYYFGMRRYPYCTDMNKNPLTYKDIDLAQALSHSGVPRSPIVGTTANEVHNMGEVWCAMLWEARANLIAKYGGAAGNQLMLQLVTDGMNLCPANPTFIQARDAILQADLVDNARANQEQLWAAFAKRGMGFSATSPANSTTAGVHEAYDMPDSLRIVPATGFWAKGPAGGPIIISSTNFVLSNADSGPLNWVMATSCSWLDFSVSEGTIEAGGNTLVAVSLNSAANTLGEGVYSDTIWFTNLNSLKVHSRPVTLMIGQTDYFTQMFYDHVGIANALSYKTFTFTPDHSRSFYTVCERAATSFPTDRTGATLLQPNDDNYNQISLTGTNTVAIYGTRTNVLCVGANGYVSMNAGEFRCYETYAQHFSLPRISGLFLDLDPGMGGSINWKELSNRVAISYCNVPEYNRGGDNNFQIELFFDGRIRITYLRLDVTHGIVGLSDGSGIPENFSPSDFNAVQGCPPLFALQLPSYALNEGNGSLPGVGQVQLAAPAATNVTVTLFSSDATEIMVPTTAIIPSGQSAAEFDLMVVDDTEVDGTQWPTITASAPGYESAAASVQVNDNEFGSLWLLLPATAMEGESVQGTVRLSRIPAADITVDLKSSDVTELQLPAWVIVPAGQNSVAFTASVMRDSILDGPQNVTASAHVANWYDGVAVISVVDSGELQIQLPPKIWENAGLLLNAGVVRLPCTTPTNLVVSLVSSRAKLVVPTSIVIPAGQSSNTFSITVLDNALLDGNDPVMVSAWAPGFVGAAASSLILDDEIAPKIARQPAMQLRSVGDIASFSVVVLGAEPFYYQWTSNGTNLVDATNSTLTLNNVQLDDSGPYAVQIRNGYGSTLSSNAILIVANPNPTQIDPSFNPGVNGGVQCAAIQPDGKILVGGWLSQPQSGIARLNQDGSYDESFSCSTYPVHCIIVQPDGKILIGGDFITVNGQERKGLARLYPDGRLDESFTIQIATAPAGWVRCMLVQRDGKVVIGGNFGNLGGQPRSFIGRLNADATLDLTFHPEANGTVMTAAEQPDGKIVVGGAFSMLGAAYRDSIGRLNPDGSLDSGFNPGADNEVDCLIVQPDNKILVSGSFKIMGGNTNHWGVARLETDGSVDPNFKLSITNHGGSEPTIYAMALRTDGKILVGGWFENPASPIPPYLAQFNPDGTLDTSFNAGLSSAVFSLTIQPDGKVLAGGVFSSISGQDRKCFARLTPTLPAAQSLTFDGSSIDWQRVGSSPEVFRTTFDVSTNGLGWFPLGEGIRTANGWQLTGLECPSNASLRAWAYAGGGHSVSSAGILQTFSGPPVILSPPTNQSTLAEGTATFTVVADGLTPFQYQWQFNGANIDTATNASLILTNVQEALAGYYTVVVTNRGGAITSPPAKLSVAKRPHLGIAWDGDQILITWPVNGLRLILESSTSMETGDWTVASDAQQIGDAWVVRRNKSDATRFYRLRFP